MRQVSSNSVNILDNAWEVFEVLPVHVIEAQMQEIKIGFSLDRWHNRRRGRGRRRLSSIRFLLRRKDSQKDIQNPISRNDGDPIASFVVLEVLASSGVVCVRIPTPAA